MEISELDRRFEDLASDHFRVHKGNIDYFYPEARSFFRAAFLESLDEVASALIEANELSAYEVVYRMQEELKNILR